MNNALSGDIDFLRIINSSFFSGFVHSTFNRTFNIHCLENGELFTIACSKIDNAPNTLVIDLDRFTSVGIGVKDRVYTINNVLYVENKLFLTIENAVKWESILPEYPCDTEVLIRNLAKMKEYISLHGTGGGIKKKAEALNPFEAELSSMLEKRTHLLINELLKGRISTALSHAVSLVGLGPGLTPSGDDFLTGLFAILNMKNSPFYPYRSLCQAILKEAKTLTNEISYITLKKAAIGKVRESIISLLNSLLVDNDYDLFLSLNKLLNIGSSSGTDIALGIVFGLEANIRAGGKVC